jgi:hypothetical protein
VNEFVGGAICFGYFVAGLFFVRFWLRTRDQLFGLFAIAFFVLSGHRLGLSLTTERNEDALGFYVARLFAFILILVAIWLKNRGRSDAPR